MRPKALGRAAGDVRRVRSALPLPVMLLFAGCLVEPTPNSTLFACEDGDLGRIQSLYGDWRRHKPQGSGTLRWPVTAATCDEGRVRIDFRPAPQEEARLEFFLVHDPPYQNLNHDADLDDPNSFRLTFDRFSVDGQTRDPYRVDPIVQLRSFSAQGLDLHMTLYTHLECGRCSHLQLRVAASPNA